MLFKGKGSIGLDLGSSYIKTVKLKESKGSYELELFDIHTLPPELIVDGSIIDSIRLVDSIKEMIKKTGIKTKDTVISISGHSSVIIKRISLPEMSEEDLSESIKFEAEQYVPFDIEDVNLDFQILGPKEELGEMDVILVLGTGGHAPVSGPADIRFWAVQGDAVSQEEYPLDRRGLDLRLGGDREHGDPELCAPIGNEGDWLRWFRWGHG